jgi:hypothetical protein
MPVRRPECTSLLSIASSSLSSILVVAEELRCSAEVARRNLIARSGNRVLEMNFQ